jgi:hypothetical protein
MNILHLQYIAKAKLNEAGCCLTGDAYFCSAIASLHMESSL